MSSTYLNEPNHRRLLAEALAAKIEAILANETSLVGAEAALWDSNKTDITSWTKLHSPLAATLAKLARTREPNSVVCHLGEYMSPRLSDEFKVSKMLQKQDRAYVGGATT